MFRLNRAFSPENTRLIHRAIYWAAGHEEDFHTWTCSNVNTECAWFPGNKQLVVINNSGTDQSTDVCDDDGNLRKVEVPAHGIKIIEED